MTRQREEEQEPTQLARKISTEGVGAKISQDGMTMTITDVWAQLVGGAGDKGKYAVTEAPAGEVIHIYASYDCYWAEGSFWDPWAVAITVSGDGIANAARTRIGADRGSGKMKLDDDGANVMPDKDISLVFKPWGHPDGGTTTLPGER